MEPDEDPQLNTSPDPGNSIEEREEILYEREVENVMEKSTEKAEPNSYKIMNSRLTVVDSP